MYRLVPLELLLVNKMIKELYQIIRRRFYFAFRIKYIKRQMENRKGSCNHCSCCDIKFFCFWDYNCPQHNKKTKRCNMGDTSKWKNLCFYYPFDEKDKWDRFKDECGFYWD